MTIKNSGTQLSFSEIETEFGNNPGRTLGQYRRDDPSNNFDNASPSGSSLSGLPLDTGIPTGSNDEIMKLDNLREKWISFGWETIEIDGHDIEKLKYFLAKDKEKKPRAIIANTIKGKGFSFSENNNSWHHAVMTKKFYDQAKEELEKNFKL